MYAAKQQGLNESKAAIPFNGKKATCLKDNLGRVRRSRTTFFIFN